MARRRTAKTIDAELYVGSSSWLQKLTGITGFALAPTNSISDDTVVGQADLDASIHSQQYAATINGLRDSIETDTLESHEGEHATFVMIREASAHRLAMMLPTEVPSMTDTGPQTDSITRALGFGQEDRAAFGNGTASVTAFTFTASDNSETLPASFAKADRLFMVLETRGSTLTSITVTSGANTQVVTIGSAGIYEVELGAAFPDTVTGATLDVTSGQTGSGYFLILQNQEIEVG